MNLLHLKLCLHSNNVVMFLKNNSNVFEVANGGLKFLIVYTYMNDC